MCNHHCFHLNCCYCNQYCTCCGAYIPNGHHWWCRHWWYYNMPCPQPVQINIKIELPKPIAKRKSKNDW